jgi:hypothetical protein
VALVRGSLCFAGERTEGDPKTKTHLRRFMAARSQSLIRRSMAEKASNRRFRDGHHIGVLIPTLTLPNDAALAAGSHRVNSRK